MKTVLVFTMVLALIFGNSLTSIASVVEKTTLNQDEISKFQTTEDNSLNELAAGEPTAAKSIIFLTLVLGLTLFLALSA